MGAETTRIGDRDVPLRDQWTTPLWLVDRLHARWGFSLDAAATEETVVRVKSAFSDDRYPLHYIGPDHEDPVFRDGLRAPWTSGLVATFVNPPYSQRCGGISKWVQACILHGAVAPVVAVLPATPDCRWWRMAHETAAEVTLFDGRVRFDPPPGVKASQPRVGTAVFAWVPRLTGPAKVVWDSVPTRRTKTNA